MAKKINPGVDLDKEIPWGIGPSPLFPGGEVFWLGSDNMPHKAELKDLELPYIKGLMSDTSIKLTDPKVVVPAIAGTGIGIYVIWKALQPSQEASAIKKLTEVAENLTEDA